MLTFKFLVATEPMCKALFGLLLYQPRAMAIDDAV
ncbi:MAG: hypothetical protein ACJAY2_003870 [Pseudomonadales bacterium]|jgi:hypothetical protein